jgi:hypothetical protein
MFLECRAPFVFFENIKKEFAHCSRCNDTTQNLHTYPAAVKGRCPHWSILPPFLYSSIYCWIYVVSINDKRNSKLLLHSEHFKTAAPLGTLQNWYSTRNTSKLILHLEHFKTDTGCSLDGELLSGYNTESLIVDHCWCHVFRVSSSFCIFREHKERVCTL